MLNTYIVGTDGCAQEAVVAGPIPEWERRITESITSLLTNYIDPLDALKDDDTGELWLPVGATGGKGADHVLDEASLRLIRDECRLLASVNEFAICGHENRISYIVGTGHGYTVEAKPGKKVADKRKEKIQAEIDEFIDASKWHQRQQEIVRRKDRDGECFLRFFPGDVLRVRFVEPGLVATPTEASGVPNHRFGIITDPVDVETVEGYYVDGQLVAAAEIQHRKLGVDANVLRGIPLFYPVRKNLKRAEKLLRNMSVVAEIQSAIAMIRKHKQATQATVEALISANADASTYNSASGKTTNYRQYAAGTIMDVNQGTEYEFPTSGIDAGKYVLVLQAELRAVASRLVMPEFMLTSDASNANYSSTMVAEGPAVKMFSRLQWDMIDDDLYVMQRVLDNAVRQGRLSQADVDNTYIDVQPPRLETRDRKSEVDANVAEVTAKIMSKHTARLRDNLDPEAEERQIEEETETSMANNPFAGMGAVTPEPPEEGDDEGDEEDEGKEDETP